MGSGTVSGCFMFSKVGMTTPPSRAFWMLRSSAWRWMVRSIMQKPPYSELPYSHDSTRRAEIKRNSRRTLIKKRALHLCSALRQIGNQSAEEKDWEANSTP